MASTNNPYKKKRSINFIKILPLPFIICGTILFFSSIDFTTTSKNTNKIRQEAIATLRTKTSQCESLDFKPNEPKPKEEWKEKQIWFAMHHHSLPDSVPTHLINRLTKLSNGGKSFYVSMKNTLRHCIGHTQTAVCYTGDLPKEKHRSIYFDKYMMLIRNPTGQFPYTSNQKDEKYHDLKGEMTKEQWKNVRDTWIDKMMDEWVKKITEWRSTDYEDGLYIVYEDLMDPVLGPGVVGKIASLLKESGFETEEDEQNIECIWLQAIGLDNIEHFSKNGYDYEDYVPGYTKEQQAMMMTKLKQLMDDVGDSNGELKGILQRYYDDIRDNTVISE